MFSRRQFITQLQSIFRRKQRPITTFVERYQHTTTATNPPSIVFPSRLQSGEKIHFVNWNFARGLSECNVNVDGVCVAVSKCWCAMRLQNACIQFYGLITVKIPINYWNEKQQKSLKIEQKNVKNLFMARAKQTNERAAENEKSMQFVAVFWESRLERHLAIGKIHLSTSRLSTFCWHLAFPYSDRRRLVLIR